MKFIPILLIFALTLFVLGASSCQKTQEAVTNNTNSNTAICPEISPASPTLQAACAAQGGQLKSKTDINGCQTAPECVIPNQVVIKDFSFSPAELTVTKGARVFWKNEDSVEHTVTFDTNQFYFINYKIQPGQEVSDYFNIQGTYTYHCSIHPSMQGKIIVQ